jgi:hypothetical protein
MIIGRARTYPPKPERSMTSSTSSGTFHTSLRIVLVFAVLA